MTRRHLLPTCALLVPLCLAGACLAQSPAPAGTPPVEPRTERIRIEDSGSRIDELRIGGETRSITVQPKGGMPTYQVLPSSANRGPTAGERAGTPGSGGTRVWNVLGF